jgi:hypothetical protein
MEGRVLRLQGFADQVVVYAISRRLETHILPTRGGKAGGGHAERALAGARGPLPQKETQV